MTKLQEHVLALAEAQDTGAELRKSMNHSDLSNYERYVHTEAERIREAMAKVRL